ncbi:hypothetical protein Q1695_002978 [Nippostrongylus brasiliensis]|nr:hypothetical protein Q1695_002978 [Nippostrongylus brasiliensis]
MAPLYTTLQLGFLFAAVCGDSKQCCLTCRSWRRLVAAHCTATVAASCDRRRSSLRQKPQHCTERICTSLFALAVNYPSPRTQQHTKIPAAVLCKGEPCIFSCAATGPLPEYTIGLRVCIRAKGGHFEI